MFSPPAKRRGAVGSYLPRLVYFKLSCLLTCIERRPEAPVPEAHEWFPYNGRRDG